MDIRDLRLTLRRNWLFAILAFDLCIVIGIAAAFLPQPTYRASTSLSAQPVIAAGGSDPAKLTQFQIPIVITTAESRSIKLQIRETIPSELAPFGVSVTVLAQTSVLTVQAESPSPQAAAYWANMISETIIADETLAATIRIEILDHAVEPNTPISPRPVPIMLAAGVLGLIAAAFAAIFATAPMTCLRSSVLSDVKSPPEPAVNKIVLPWRAPWSTSHCTLEDVDSRSRDPSLWNIVARGTVTPLNQSFACSAVSILSP